MGQSETIRTPFMSERNLFDELMPGMAELKEMVDENDFTHAHEDDSGLNSPASWQSAGENISPAP